MRLLLADIRRLFQLWKLMLIFPIALISSCGGNTQQQNTFTPGIVPVPLVADQNGVGNFRHMRAVHAMGNWGGNTTGFAKPLFSEAQSVTVKSVQVQAMRSNYVDGDGVSQTNDLAQVSLNGVQFSNGKILSKAGFWVYSNARTGVKGIQFRPGLDTNLSGISGFTGDVFIAIPEVVDGQSTYLTQVAALTGDARALVLAVITNSPDFLNTATYSIEPGMTFGDKTTLINAMARARSVLVDPDSTYFNFLSSMNVNWIGISVAMHYDSFSNPKIVTRTCPNGRMLDSGNSYTACTFPDEDLVSFIGRAKSRGFKIYLTLAFESSSETVGLPSGPACGTSNYKMSRFWLGAPALPSGTDPAKCIAAGDWWWNPSHPAHKTNVAQFWESYQQIAEKYALLSQANGVDLYSIGTETENLFRTRAGNGAYANHFNTQLNSLVAAVRRLYSGALTYDQHYYPMVHPEHTGGMNSTQYLFTDLNLDVVGISAYFELVKEAPNRLLSMSELETAWESIFKNYLKPLQTRNPGKPLIFTEIGYVDDINSPFSQGINATTPQAKVDINSPTPGMLQQQNIFQSFFNINARYGDLIGGTFIWGNDYTPFNSYSCTQIDWAISCRSARNTLTSVYAKWKALDSGLAHIPSTPLDDIFIGLSGLTNTISYAGKSSEYVITLQASGEIQVKDKISGRDGIDKLSNIQRLQFSDVNVAVDLQSANSAGGIYRLYAAAFNRTPDLAGLGYWIAQADNGLSATTIATSFTYSAEFEKLFGVKLTDNYATGMNIGNIVNGFYTNVLHRPPDSGGLAYYSDLITSRKLTVGQVLLEIANSPENNNQVAEQINKGITYIPFQIK